MACIVVFAIAGFIGIDPVDVSGGWTDFMTLAEGDRNAGFATPTTLALIQEGQTVGGAVVLMGPGLRRSMGSRTPSPGRSRSPLPQSSLPEQRRRNATGYP